MLVRRFATLSRRRVVVSLLSLALAACTGRASTNACDALADCVTLRTPLTLSASTRFSSQPLEASFALSNAGPVKVALSKVFIALLAPDAGTDEAFMLEPALADVMLDPDASVSLTASRVVDVADTPGEWLVLAGFADHRGERVIEDRAVFEVARITSTLQLDRVSGTTADTLTATYTVTNSGRAPVQLAKVSVLGVAPGGGVVEFTDARNTVTLPPGESLTLQATHAFSASEPLGTWAIKSRWQAADGTVVDSASQAFELAWPSTPEWPFDQPPRAVLRASPKRVYAHWHLYPLSIDNLPADVDYYATQLLDPSGEGTKHLAYAGLLRERPLGRLAVAGDWLLHDALRDVTLAKAAGLDGFFINLWNEAPLWSRWQALFTAAAQLGDFDLIPNFDLGIMSALSDEQLASFIVDTLSRLSVEPALLRIETNVIIGFFLAEARPPAFYEQLLARLKTELGLEANLVLVFLGTGSEALLTRYAPVASTFAGWGTAVPQTAGGSQAMHDAAALLGKNWVQPILAQDFRPSSAVYWEAHNSQSLQSAWKDVIASEVDWVQVVTWNDHAEHHSIRPSTGKQWATYDLTAYFITAFKLGHPPPIVRDALYYFHRIHRSDLVPSAQPTLATCRSGAPSDELEVVSFLQTPGTIEVEQGGQLDRHDAPAGLDSVRFTPRVGRPAFRLLHDGDAGINFMSSFAIHGAVTRQDLLYRSGGSLRAALGSCASVCTNSSVDAGACETCPGEPVWLVSDPL